MQHRLYFFFFTKSYETTLDFLLLRLLEIFYLLNQTNLNVLSIKYIGILDLY